MKHPFDDADLDPTVTEAWGIRWLVYWRLQGDTTHLYMRRGDTEIEIIEPREWLALCADAALAAGVEASCDLACDRLQVLLQQRQ